MSTKRPSDKESIHETKINIIVTYCLGDCMHVCMPPSILLVRILQSSQQTDRVLPVQQMALLSSKPFQSQQRLKLAPSIYRMQYRIETFLLHCSFGTEDTVFLVDHWIAWVDIDGSLGNFHKGCKDLPRSGSTVWLAGTSEPVRITPLELKQKYQSLSTLQTFPQAVQIPLL
mmetsp:Transcript_5282/g.6686  ORF Transcript_5282/g.6686 Transcript_5282/m.6686 type:complete len:172 (+) Transcript_5282:193-708(+)